MPDGQARAPAGEPPVGHQRAGLAEAAALQKRRRIQHFLHARPAARPLVADYDDVPRTDAPVEDRLNRLLLGLDHHGWAGEGQDGLVDTCGLHHAAVLGEVAAQDR